MRHILLLIALTLLTAGTAAAQQAPCRSVYRLGEYVPPACQDRQRTGVPAYQRWGEGFGATQTTPPHAPAAASRPDWRYFGGYNAAYGFGR